MTQKSRMFRFESQWERLAEGLPGRAPLRNNARFFRGRRFDATCFRVVSSSFPVPGRGGRTKGTLFKLAINGLTARQGTARIVKIGAKLEKICRSRHQRRTSLEEPVCGGVIAVGTGAEVGYFGQVSSGERKL